MLVCGCVHTLTTTSLTGRWKLQRNNTIMARNNEKKKALTRLFSVPWTRQTPVTPRSREFLSSVKSCSSFWPRQLLISHPSQQKLILSLPFYPHGKRDVMDLVLETWVLLVHAQDVCVHRPLHTHVFPSQTSQLGRNTWKKQVTFPPPALNPLGRVLGCRRPRRAL